ncbi:Phosphatidate cytidylyltransferase [Candidatus Ecksteinia adelgidicola]|nr:Phosphatidate cytidylyltransferase [Candidatus Ecksteinia adelgidicola]
MVCVGAIWEWGKIARLTLKNQRIFLTILFILLLVIIMFLYFNKNYMINYFLTKIFCWLSLIWWFIALILVIFYPYSSIFWYHSLKLHLFFCFLTILPFFWSFLILREFHYKENNLTGSWLLLYLMLLIWSMDSGAYICGKLFGKNKLAPHLSPGKTWEGLIGGLIISMFVSWKFSRYWPLKIDIITLLCLSFIISLVSVLGDLTESMFKRAANVKDSGHIIPGHGGILDRIDSLTSAAPLFVCLILLFFNI